MKVKIITPEFRMALPVPVPLSFGTVIIKAMPQSVFDKIEEQFPPRLKWLASKEVILYMYRECISILQEHKGLEAVHIEASDGTFISVKL